MDSFEVNKIVGAVLGTLLFVMGIGFIAEAIYAPKEGQGPGYALPEPDGETVATAAPVETPLPVLLANASADDGARVAKKCASCHNFGEGEGNKTGPHLFGIVGHEIAAVPDFSYSDALQELAATQGVWTYEALNAFVANPKSYAPGTKMGFTGLRSETERADLLAYLQTLSNDPVPFPEVEEAPAEDAAAEEGDMTGDMPAEDSPAATTDAAPATTDAAPETTQDAPAATVEEEPAAGN